ncbi:MAG: aspartyl-phosphate phosphatase Spo0E family protein [Firmicutes bacterium]|nr:aspartyl-phosphate phosphatase Spo0E family protein [Bacillota bacterium]
MNRQERALLRAMSILSRKLSQLAESGTPLTNPEMVEVSQQLDRVIVTWHHLRESREKDA